MDKLGVNNKGQDINSGYLYNELTTAPSYVCTPISDDW